MRRFPLFIIDTDRSHGRSVETDYLACTSVELPFVAQVDMITEQQYLEEYDPANAKAVYSDPRNGIRLRIRVVSVKKDFDKSQLKSLLRRALKEVLLRKKTMAVDINDISNDAVVKVMDTLRQQTYEQLRDNPNDKTAKMMKAVFSKVINDYNESNTH